MQNDPEGGLDLSVSVVIPVFNGESYVARAVHSALAQTFPPLEVTVVDDGSTDGTRAALDALGSSIRLVRIEHTGLAAAARNVGTWMSGGTHVAFLDADDEWTFDKLEKQLREFRAHPELGLVCSNAYRVRGEGTSPHETFHHDRLPSSDRSFADLVRDNFVIASSAVIRRECFARVGGFSTSRDLAAVEDYDLWLRIAATHSVRYLAEPLVLYTDTGPSYRSSFSRLHGALGVAKALENAASCLPTNDIKNRIVVRRRLAAQLYYASRLASEAGERGLQRRLVWRAASEWPKWTRLTGRGPDNREPT